MLDLVFISNIVGYGVISEVVVSIEFVDFLGVCDSIENGSNRIVEEINLLV